MLNDVMQNVITLNVVMLSVVRLSVVAPIFLPLHDKLVPPTLANKSTLGPIL
jgi:hypothetical protein